VSIVVSCTTTVKLEEAIDVDADNDDLELRDDTFSELIEY
jgi:hypothetical protein